jgi:hypothetical protein
MTGQVDRRRSAGVRSNISIHLLDDLAGARLTILQRHFRTFPLVFP